MPTLASLDDDERVAALAHLSRLKHDLGKYIAFQIRWLGPDATVDERRQALSADLLQTRRGPEGSVSAPEVWAAARAGLLGDQPIDGGVTIDLSDEPLVQQLDAAMLQVDGLVAALREGSADDEAVQRGCELALGVAQACKQLVHAARHGESLG